MLGFQLLIIRYAVLRLLRLPGIMFLLLFFENGFSQNAFNSENLIVTSYTNENGLRQSMVSQVTQDKQGLIWMVTGDGLHYFDGQQFRFFRVPYSKTCNQTDNVMRSIFETHSGELIVGSTSSLLNFNTANGTFRLIYRKEGFYPILFDQCIDNQPLIWIRGYDFCLLKQNRISRITLQFDPGNLLPATFIPQKAIRLSKDVILISSDEGLLWITLPDNSKSKIYRSYWMPVPGISGIAKSGKGKVVLFAKGKLLNLSRDKKLNLIAETKINSNPRLFVDSRENIWLSDQHYNKLYRFSDNKITEINLFSINASRSDLIRPSIISVFEDKKHNLWFGTDGNGVLVYNPSKVQFQRADIGFTRCIAGLHSTIWAGTFNNGLWELNADLSSQRKVNPAHFNNKIYFLDMVADTLGRMWIAMRNGLEVVDASGNVVWKYPFQCQLAKFVSLNDSALLIADNQLFKFRIRKIPQLYSQTRYLPARALLCIDDYYWVGSADGLYRYSKKLGLTATNLPVADKYKLSSIPVYSFVFDNGLLWVATGNGVQCYEKNGLKHKLPSCLEAIKNDVVYSIIADNNHRLWVTGNNGIGCVSPSEDRMISFSSVNNLQSPEFNYNAFCKTGNSHFYFGGIQGLNHINPLSFVPDKEAPELKLISLYVSDTAYSVGIPPANLNFKLSRLSPHVSGSVFSTDYLNKGVMQFSFFMDGYQKVWSKPTNDAGFTYRNLPSGEYRLYVKCADAYMNWSKPYLLFSFSITPPFYSTWWFMVLLAVSIVIITVLIVKQIQRLRYQKLTREMERQFAIEKERTRISKDMHDEVGASLTRISILSELAKNQQSEPVKIQQLVGQISEISGDVVDEMREIIWAMNPRNDTLDSFASYIRQYISGYLETADIQGAFSFPDEITSHFMSSELRRNLFLTVKEAVHNVVKHADATKVIAGLNFTGHKLEITVSDNGKGFDEKKTESWGNGLINMRKRMEESGGTFAIESSLSSGTSIKLEVQLRAR